MEKIVFLKDTPKQKKMGNVIMPGKPILKGSEYLTISEVIDGVKWYIFITEDGQENFMKEEDLKKRAKIVKEDE